GRELVLDAARLIAPVTVEPVAIVALFVVALHDAVAAGAGPALEPNRVARHARRGGEAAHPDRPAPGQRLSCKRLTQRQVKVEGGTAMIERGIGRPGSVGGAAPRDRHTELSRSVSGDLVFEGRDEAYVGRIQACRLGLAHLKTRERRSVAGWVTRIDVV